MITIFVFGSNLAGRHGKGTALEAYNHYGATWGQGTGRQGNSYAIATRDGRSGCKITGALPLDDIRAQVDQFVAYASNHPKDIFTVTRIGCGLAGYTDADIKPMFVNAPINCNLPEGWRKP